MKYKCETCGEVFEGEGRGPYVGNVILSRDYWYHLPCARKESDGMSIKILPPYTGRLITNIEEINTVKTPVTKLDVCKSKTPITDGEAVFSSDSRTVPEEIARLHECADHLARRIVELRAAQVDLDGPAQAMATASIKREVERCWALLGEIEAEYLPPDYYYQDQNGTKYRPGSDPEATCWHCKKTFLCDPMDACCRLCHAPFDKTRCDEFGFKPQAGKGRND